jgi:hypothetical protein
MGDPPSRLGAHADACRARYSAWVSPVCDGPESHRTQVDGMRGEAVGPEDHVFFLTGLTFSLMAYLTNSILPSIPVHALGLLMFFTLGGSGFTFRRRLCSRHWPAGHSADWRV